MDEISGADVPCWVNHFVYQTQSLVYLAHITGHFPDCFSWSQAMQGSTLFQFFKNWGSHVLFQCTAVNVRFSITTLSEGAVKF
jgi:hypothetical protein